MPHFQKEAWKVVAFLFGEIPSERTSAREKPDEKKLLEGTFFGRLFFPVDLPPLHLMTLSRSVLFLSLFLGGPLQAVAQDRPNLLWIVSEDNGPFLGSYGDENARTPHLDRLAAEGIRFTNCFANAPVCAVARSSWIFGVPAVSLGTMHMRSKYAVPRDLFPTYPELFRKAGYYTTNQSKTDYNTQSIDPKRIWDFSGRKAHYKNRPEGAPFFAVFNLTTSHESRIFPPNKVKGEPRVASRDIRVPPYQVATQEVIHDWRSYYESLAIMDASVGALLEELERRGEAENTIVFYCSDHGGVTLRSKRFLHDTGTRVPLLAYFPPKWQHLAPSGPGTVSDRLVQFIDMPKTWLALAQITPPERMPGRVFLGAETDPAPETVFLFSGRFDEAPDTSRAVTDGRWKYIRNFEPDRLRFQMLSYPLRQEGQLSQWEAHQQGKTNPAQAAQFLPQPPEELYDTQADPHEVKNLAASQPEKLAEMRAHLRAHILETRDLGFLPEPLLERVNQSKKTTLYEYGQASAHYPLPEVLDLALLASEQDPRHIEAFVKALDHENPALRHWGALGLRILGQAAAPAKPALERAVQDSEVSVRVPALVALGRLGEKERVLPLLVKEADQARGDIHATWALDGLKLLDAPEAISGKTIEALTRGPYSQRIFEILERGGSTYRLWESPL
ncbi:MAG: sulfatase-like hydrolase/transferase [Verrucomicrobiota bacterium]